MVSAYMHTSTYLKDISSIRRALSTDAANTLIHSLITSKLDYCNSLLVGAPHHLVRRLQRVQNLAAKIVLNAPRRSNSLCALRQLHWLPVKERIMFKAALITFKILNNLAPEYLCGEIIHYEPRRTLRSESLNLLQVPRFKYETVGNTAFCAVAPKVWNKLPSEIKCAKDVNSFKSLLKTFFFKSVFNQ